MKPDEFIVYVVAGNEAEALQLGEEVVRQRLAACVNLLGPLRSIYWWNGEIHNGAEVAFLAKTTRASLPALIARIKALHSYTCPCIVALPIAAGHPAFLAWIHAETDGAAAPKRISRPAGSRRPVRRGKGNRRVSKRT